MAPRMLPSMILTTIFSLAVFGCAASASDPAMGTTAPELALSGETCEPAAFPIGEGECVEECNPFGMCCCRKLLGFCIKSCFCVPDEQ